MSKRLIAGVFMIVLGTLNMLNVFDVIQLGWLIWPVAIATIVVAIFLITTPSDKDIGNG